MRILIIGIEDLTAALQMWMSDQHRNPLPRVISVEMMPAQGHGQVAIKFEKVKEPMIEPETPSVCPNCREPKQWWSLWGKRPRDSAEVLPVEAGSHVGAGCRSDRPSKVARPVGVRPVDVRLMDLRRGLVR